MRNLKVGLVAVFLLGVILFHFPLIADLNFLFQNVPFIFIYLFSVWIFIIVINFLLFFFSKKH